MTRSPNTLAVRKLTPADWIIYREVRLASLQDSPDAFGSTFDREQGFPDEAWRHRLDEEPLSYPVGVFDNDQMIGLSAGRIDSQTKQRVDVYQMWVAPEHRGRGASRLLLENILDWARQQNVIEAHLQVTVGNSAAESLYRASGFVDAGESEPLREGSDILSQPMMLLLADSAG